jgi:hypothetical protein
VLASGEDGFSDRFLHPLPTAGTRDVPRHVEEAESAAQVQPIDIRPVRDVPAEQVVDHQQAGQGHVSGHADNLP